MAFADWLSLILRAESSERLTIEISDERNTKKKKKKKEERRKKKEERRKQKEERRKKKEERRKKKGRNNNNYPSVTPIGRQGELGGTLWRNLSVELFLEKC